MLLTYMTRIHTLGVTVNSRRYMVLPRHLRALVDSVSAVPEMSTNDGLERSILAGVQDLLRPHVVVARALRARSRARLFRVGAFGDDGDLHRVRKT